jgi:hypothetical protein
VTVPLVVICPKPLGDSVVNQNVPSCPAVIPWTWPLPPGRANSVITPAAVMRPILLPLSSANHNAPSGPSAIPWGSRLAVGMGNSVIAPLIAISPILLVKGSVNHSPPGPDVMRPAPALLVGIGDSYRQW